MKIADNWYESFFAGINCEMWEKAPIEEWTRSEIGFLKILFGAPSNIHLLDLPCGAGRHSLELAKAGYEMTGVDISEDFLKSFRKKAEEQNIAVEIIQGNILTMSLPYLYDGAFCLGNSFGYFVYEDMEIFVEKVAAALKPNAKWVVNTGVVAESFLRKFSESSRYELDGLIMEIHNEYDVWESCLLTKLTYIKDDKEILQYFKHHVYTVAEIIRLFKKYGLKTIGLYASPDGAAYKLGDSQIYVVAEKVG